ncbi:MAG TPA: hypothetical protein VH763_11360 [Gemmatimonadales bacterium]
MDDERIGVQGSIPLGWRLTLNPAFSYLYNYPDDPTGFFEGSAWETYFTLRVQPLRTAAVRGKPQDPLTRR